MPRSIPVEASPYATFFEGRDDVRVLDKGSAAAFWHDTFGRSTTWFSMAAGGWLDDCDWVSIGRWEVDDVRADTDALGAELRAALSWRADEPIAYCITRTQVITASWSTFLATWPAFIDAACDGVLLVSRERPRASALLILYDGRLRRALPKG